MSEKKPLEPLIPLDQLKEVVSKIVSVPKEQIDKAQAEREKRELKTPRT